MESITNYFSELEQMMQAISLSDLQAVLSILEEAYHNGHRIFVMGNGGSAATASHFALDLAKNTIMPGAPRLKAISLTDHVPLITAWSNDTHYEHIFAEQLANLIESQTGYETRVTVLGHIQRGGTPTAFDRVLATRFGVQAADMVHRGEFGKMASLRGNQIVAVPLTEATAHLKTVDPALYSVAEVFFG